MYLHTRNEAQICERRMSQTTNGKADLPQLAPLEKYKLVFWETRRLGRRLSSPVLCTTALTLLIRLLLVLTFCQKLCILTIGRSVCSYGIQLGKNVSVVTVQVIFDSSVAVIVYDITNRKSFANTAKWIEDVRAERGDDVVIMLVGNKTDMSDRRQVSVEEAEKRQKKKNWLHRNQCKRRLQCQSTFRKLATRLPGLENATEEINSNNMIDIKLTPVQNDVVKPQDDGGCGC